AGGHGQFQGGAGGPGGPEPHQGQGRGPEGSTFHGCISTGKDGVELPRSPPLSTHILWQPGPHVKFLPWENWLLFRAGPVGTAELDSPRERLKQAAPREIH